jgi:hypothetical protein
MLSHKKKFINLSILFCTLIIFLIRWLYPLINFDEKIDVSIIFESISDGYMYFAPFKAFTNLDLNYSFDPVINDLKNITIPTGAFYLHFIFYYFLSSWGFVILEFAFILFFLIIFYKISRLLNFERIESLLISIILFNIPIFLELFSLSGTKYLTVIYSEFYSFRFPRPLVSNIFFYSFILCILKNLNKNFFNKKNLTLLGVISGLSFTSFFHIFILEQLVLIFIVFYIYKKDTLRQIKKNLNLIILYFISFFLISLPFFINIFFAEVEFLERMGLTELNYERKIFLLGYLFKKLLSIQFLLTTFFSILLLLYVNHKNNFFNVRKLNFFFIIFYTSILTPFVFVLLSPSFFSHFYLFNNVILISAFLLFFFVIILIIKSNFIKLISSKTTNNFVFFIIIITLFCNLFQSHNNYNEIKLSENSIKLRNEFNTISNLVEKNKHTTLNNSSLLTFDNRFLIWSILNNVKYLKIPNGIFISKTHEMIENDLIQTFKYLKLSKDDFYNFIKNKRLSSWRFRNENIKNLFWMRYQANSLITYKNSKTFDKKILDFITNSSPLLSQQLVVPSDEIERLLLKFDNIIPYYEHPNLIIINKKNKILVKSIIDLNFFCKEFEGEYYIYYRNLESHLNCSK